MKVNYLVQQYIKSIRKYVTIYNDMDLERAKIMANKPYNTRQGTITTRVLKITEESVCKFTRSEKKK